MSPFRSASLVIAALALLTAPAAAQTARRSPLPPPPVLLHWPDPAFLASRQCHGYARGALDRLLPRARLGLRLPGTRSVALDRERGCITVRVDDVGSGRLVELLLRGVSVPRAAVLLELAEPSRS
jgi:hypothetical protein